MRAHINISIDIWMNRYMDYRYIVVLPNRCIVVLTYGLNEYILQEYGGCHDL